MKKVRLRRAYMEKNLSESRSQVQRLIMAGQVRVDGQVVLKPSAQYHLKRKYRLMPGRNMFLAVARNLKAHISFHMLDLRGMVCADVGASTGGFSDCYYSMEQSEFTRLMWGITYCIGKYAAMRG